MSVQFTGLLFVFLSGVCNGLFSAPMKMLPRWKWENIWGAFIVTACLVLPAGVILATVPNYGQVINEAPPRAVAAAVGFGFAWGFGAILFGRSVDRLGVSLANSMVIGLSSALGSLVPLLLQGALRVEPRQVLLLTGVAVFLYGVWLCGRAGRLREVTKGESTAQTAGYVFAVGAGIMSAVFNIGFSLAAPVAGTAMRLGYSPFTANNCIWLLMLGAGSVPNLLYCGSLLVRNDSGRLFTVQAGRGWTLSILMGILWGGSIFLYGAATPLLGEIGPSIGWPLSLAVALLVVSVTGHLLGEWRNAPKDAIRTMRQGIGTLLIAIVLCAMAAAMKGGA